MVHPGRHLRLQKLETVVPDCGHATGRGSGYGGGNPGKLVFGKASAEDALLEALASDFGICVSGLFWGPCPLGFRKSEPRTPKSQPNPHPTTTTTTTPPTQKVRTSGASKPDTQVLEMHELGLGVQGAQDGGTQCRAT